MDRGPSYALEGQKLPGLVVFRVLGASAGCVWVSPGFGTGFFSPWTKVGPAAGSAMYEADVLAAWARSISPARLVRMCGRRLMQLSLRLES